MPDEPTSPWDAKYRAAGYAYGTRRNDFLYEEAHRLRSPVLSLGEGEGRNGVYLTTCGFDVTGVDASRLGLQKARALAAERGVLLSTIHADLADFDMGTTRWGSIIAIFCHLPKPLREDVHRRVVDALVPGGTFLLEAYCPDQVGRGTGGPPTVDLTMSLKDLRRELVGLDFVVGREVARQIEEGSAHQGMSATVQVVARKPE